MGQIEYREGLTAEDYNKLREAVGWKRLTEKQAARGIENTTFIASAWLDGKAVGMGRALFDYGYTAYIGDVIILPECQGKGVGGEIVHSLMERVKAAADEGDDLLFCLVAAEGREKFYEKLGFQRRPAEGLGSGMSVRVEVHKEESQKR